LSRDRELQVIGSGGICYTHVEILDALVRLIG